jgi:hypothetical protein
MIGEMPEEGDVTRIGWSWSRWRGERGGGGEQERRDDGAHATTTTRHRDTIGSRLTVELSARGAEPHCALGSGCNHRPLSDGGRPGQNPEGGAAL